MFTSFLQQILEHASQIAVSHFGKVSGTVKSADNNQVLTETDLEIGRYIIAQIQEKYPEHNIIDEEAGVIDKSSTFTWVVDPIDGTSNFANGIPTYGVMVGLMENDVPIASGIALPSFSEIYLAEKGKGATCNGAPIHVTDQTNLLSCLVAYGIDGHQENPQITYDEVKTLGEIVLHIRNLRSNNSVFDIAMLVKGKYGGALNRTSKIWDNVAQQILIEESGGVYTDFYGQPMNYTKAVERAEENFTFCAASHTLHTQLQEIIHKK